MEPTFRRATNNEIHIFLITFNEQRSHIVSMSSKILSFQLVMQQFQAVLYTLLPILHETLKHKHHQWNE